jgi:GPI mannosyltransferase 2
MILVWSIATQLSSGEAHVKSSVAFVAALLYIISPAGIFLSAPYTESPFAMVNMLGIRLFLLGKDLHNRGQYSGGALVTVLGGFISGAATVVRSNGILNGMFYAWDASTCLLHIAQGQASFGRVIRIVSLGIGGMLIGAGMILPQSQAYLEYCTDPSIEVIRPWCRDRFPSIFSFVQSHYWYVHICTVYV